MTTEDLSLEEINHLYKLSLMPSLAVFFIIMIYFSYLMFTDPLETLWDFITSVGWLYIFMPITLFTSFEVLSYRKTGRSFNFKRLVTRTLLILLSALSFFSFLLAMQLGFSSILGYWESVLLGCFFWVIFFTLVVIKFREFFQRFDKGDW